MKNVKIKNRMNENTKITARNIKITIEIRK